MSDIVEQPTTRSLTDQSYAQTQGNDSLWMQIFADGHPDLLKLRRVNRRLPTDPRCNLCYVPFNGIGGWWMRRRGKQRNKRNPNYCDACDKFLAAFPGGTEVVMSMLYVDIRNSTQYADSSAAHAVSQRINLFLDAVTKVITNSNGFILAFYGDCIVAVWPPGFCGPDHAQQCLHAARELVALHLQDRGGQHIPIGIGVHTGTVFIGTVTALQGSFRDVSIFGRNVNITARLAAAAKAGEALTTGDLLTAAAIDRRSLESRELQMKGIEEKVLAFTAV